MANNLSQFVSNLKEGKNKPKYSFSRTSEYEVGLFFNGPLSHGDFYSIAAGYEHRGIPVSMGSDIDPSLVQDINFYVDTVDLANLHHGGEIIELGKIYEDALGGSSCNPGITDTVLSNSMIIPQETELKMSFLDTQISIVESLILPWMYMNASPSSKLPSGITNLKQHQLTLTADIYIYLYYPGLYSKRTFRTYVFKRCKPTVVTTPNVTHKESAIIKRDVHFAFSNMEILLPSYSPEPASSSVPTTTVPHDASKQLISTKSNSYSQQGILQTAKNSIMNFFS